MGKQLRPFRLGRGAQNMRPRMAEHPNFARKYQQHRQKASANADFPARFLNKAFIHDLKHGASGKRALIDKSEGNIDLIDVPSPGRTQQPAGKFDFSTGRFCAIIRHG
jgi:hypothetical protein